jgi:hypothetical protein
MEIYDVISLNFQTILQSALFSDTSTLLLSTITQSNCN